MTNTVDVVVIGAGIVGLATARAFAKLGREVLIIEKEVAIGLHTSSRNSEVVHAGIYYEPGSLKARMCLEGKSLLYDYCAGTGIGFKRTGKLILAQSPSEIGKLQTLQKNARACGVHDLVWLDGTEAMKLEPELKCIAALHSPSTGIVDSGQLMLTLLGESEANGAMIAFRSEVVGGEISANGILLSIKSVNDDASEIRARLVINCAGHGAHALATATKGYEPKMLPPQFFAKGSYCSVSGSSPFTNHIYPIPVQGGLGTHVTNDMGGMAKLGPDVTWIPELNYDVDQNIADKFKSACVGFWPGIRDREVTPSYCGVRPKISGPGKPNADFDIQTVVESGTTIMINLFGIESPGLTASLAIAEYLVKGH